MMHSVFLTIHISAGLIGILSGFAAMIPKKGSTQHRKIGNVFFYSMLAMTLSGIYLAINQPSVLNTIVGLITFYMVVTAQRTALNRKGKNGTLEYISFVFILAVFVAGIFASIDVTETGTKNDGIPAEAYYFFTTVAGVSLLSDLWLVIKGGAYGKKRIVRHLWRMCFAHFVATSSFFLGQSHFFPDFPNKLTFLSIPILIVIISLFFWLIKTSFSFKRKLREAKV